MALHVVPGHRYNGRSAGASLHATMEGRAALAMTEGEPILRVFVMGCPRGGTTLTQRLVAERLDLVTLPETRFFASLVGNLEPRMFPRTRRRPPGLKPVTSRLREALGIGTGLEWRQVEGLPTPPARRWRRFGPAADDFVARLDALAREAGAAGWLEKTPFHVLYAPLIARLVPGAWMIHVVRDAPETVASLWEMARRHADPWGAIYDRVERAADAWNASTAASARMAGRPRQLFLPYAALAARPEAILDLVAARIAPAGSVLPSGTRAGARAPLGLERGTEPWKAAAVAGEVAPARSKWLTALTDQERATASRLICPLPAALEAAMAPFAGAPGEDLASRPSPRAVSR